jgi:hypothetical protein
VPICRFDEFWSEQIDEKHRFGVGSSGEIELEAQIGGEDGVGNQQSAYFPRTHDLELIFDGDCVREKLLFV